MTTRLFFVDCEAVGASPVNGRLTEFGVVDYASRATFYGRLWPAVPDPANPAVSLVAANAVPDPFVEYDGANGTSAESAAAVFSHLASWVAWSAPGTRPVFVSDNPGYDAMWIHAGFDAAEVPNPFGHSARRIGDLAAGLSGNWRATSAWKRWRRTPHTHHPVDDAMGNVEAFEALLARYGQSP